MDESILFSLYFAPAVFGAITALAAIAAYMAHRRRTKLHLRAERRRKRAEPGQPARDDSPRNTPTSTASLMPLRTYPMAVVDASEERLYGQLEELAEHSFMGHRVLPRVSLGAFLYLGGAAGSPAQEARRAALLAAREVDFLVVDGDWQPVAAIDLEREALSGRPADGVEAHACESAGVAYIRVAADGLAAAQIDDIKRLMASLHSLAAQ